MLRTSSAGSVGSALASPGISPATATRNLENGRGARLTPVSPEDKVGGWVGGWMGWCGEGGTGRLELRWARQWDRGWGWGWDDYSGSRAADPGPSNTATNAPRPARTSYHHITASLRSQAVYRDSRRCFKRWSVEVTVIEAKNLKKEVTR